MQVSFLCGMSSNRGFICLLPSNGASELAVSEVGVSICNTTEENSDPVACRHLMWVLARRRCADDACCSTARTIQSYEVRSSSLAPGTCWASISRALAEQVSGMVNVPFWCGISTFMGTLQCSTFNATRVMFSRAFSSGLVLNVRCAVSLACRAGRFATVPNALQLQVKVSSSGRDIPECGRQDVHCRTMNGALNVWRGRPAKRREGAAQRACPAFG